MSDLRKVNIADIRENQVALRTVDKQSEKYLGLVASIKEKGFFGAIVVRPQRDPETTEEFYELVDGLHRFCAAKDAGVKEINVDVVALDQDQMLETQIMANFHKIETKPAEYSAQLRRILARNSMMTITDLAGKLGVSPTFIQQRLGLLKIDNPKILKLIDDGEIKLSNAFSLAKLPAQEQDQWIEKAMTESFDEFGPAINARIKELREAARTGTDAAPAAFSPVAHLRKMKEIKEEVDKREIVKVLASKAESKEDAAALGIAWVLHLDPDSIAAQQAKWEQQQKEQAENKRKRAIERAAQKEERAKKAQAEAQAAREAAEAGTATEKKA